MFFRKKVPKPKVQPLLEIEKKIIDSACSGLDVKNAEKLKGQLPYFKFLNRISVPSAIDVELYPETLSSIPGDLLFERRDEFLMATVKFRNNGILYTTRMITVLGGLFYLRTKPNYLNTLNGELNNFESIKMETYL